MPIGRMRIEVCQEQPWKGPFKIQATNFFKSPSAILALARADQQRQAALEEQRIEAYKIAEQERIEEAKLKAEQQKADEQRRREIDQELADRRAERRAAWDSARRQWLQSMGLLRPTHRPTRPVTIHPYRTPCRCLPCRVLVRRPGQI